MTRAWAGAHAKDVYENMDVLAVAVGSENVGVLRRVWRARILGLNVRNNETLDLLTALVGETYGELARLTWPGERILNRWERDHGYVTR